MKPLLLLLNFGGPATTERIDRYIYNILADPANWPWGWCRWLQRPVARMIARRRAAPVAAQYAQMGGGSPLLRWTERQQAGLRAALLPTCPELQIAIGMQYWEPFIETTLEQLRGETWSDIILLPLYPHCSFTTSRACLDRVERWWQRHGRPTARIHRLESWYQHPGYIATCQQLLRETLADAPQRDEIPILFTAHGLPQAIVRQGDPYPREVLDQIMRIVGDGDFPNRWLLGYQSRVGPVKWLEPDVETCIERLGRERPHTVCVMPLSFVADQLETLYEVDVTYAEHLRQHGVQRILRVPTCNDHPQFIAALATLVREVLGVSNVCQSTSSLSVAGLRA
ncbi:MAG: ferrochelatase [Deltaproteobacteria bacterium]|nr:ferrochelatase [Deltaproteobacteria bacterium]